ncbi:MAG: trehalose-6-phosphate synthase [Gemmatimonadota bacterium]|nr:trehalose-6-phosphate synthase [Gemmatimonadota bacterium]
MSRVVVVSNRVPDPRTGEVAGGLAVGVHAALAGTGGLWFGWSGDEGAADESPEVLVHEGIRYVTLDLSQEEIDGYYNGFCNNALWPLFHYLLGFLKYDRREFEIYLRVNARFARTLLPRLQPDDIIWVHDFHLIPLASELRRLGARQPIGFFLHTPFPDYDVLRALPTHREMLRGLCAYDVIGFQTEPDLHSFRNCLDAADLGTIEEADRREPSRLRASPCADVYPIGIDVDDCATRAVESVTPRPEKTMASFGGRALVLGVDRLDYSKGLPERFQSFERLLERYPEHVGQLVLMQIAPPTRQGVRAYAEIRETLEQLAGNINGTYAQMDWVPIHYLNQGVERARLLGIMRSAKVGLVTPIRDGMNLVAKEYVAAQDPEDPGVLVLSTLAGAACELDGAVLVNPYDLDGVADALHQVIEMPQAERRRRHEAMMQVLRRNDVHAWANRFLEALRGQHVDA